MCSTAEELLHLRSILEHFGYSVSTTDLCDSVDARGSEQRAGLGKVRTLAVETWLQEVLRERGLQIKSKSSKANTADLGTKVLPVARLNALRVACGIGVLGGRLTESVEDENDDG